MTQRFLKELKGIVGRGQLKEFADTKDLGLFGIAHRGQNLTDFTSWDYLCLRANRKIVDAIHTSVESSTVSIASPRLASGNRQQHVGTEHRIAKFLGRESALLFSSRNQAVFTLFTSLLTEQDSVFMEETSHAPVADASFLVGAPTNFFSFQSENWLRKLTDSVSKVNGRAIYLFCDLLSPLTGLVAPLEELLPLVAKYNINLVIDDTYSLGSIGLRGAGSVEMFPALLSQSLCTVGSFGFGLPGFGAFISGSTELVRYLINRSKTFLAEPPVPEYLCAASELSIDLAETMISQRPQLIEQAAALASHLKISGFSVNQPKGPIVCVSFDKPSLADTFCEFLFSKGFFVERVPRGTLLTERTMVRFVLNLSHTSPGLEKLFAVISESMSRVTR